MLAALGPAAQDPDLAAVLAHEARRTRVIAECAPAVCSVMAMDAPGGGSGVVIDPTGWRLADAGGFVLTNYHVVGEPDADHELPAAPPPPEETLAAWRQRTPEADAAAEAAFVAAWQAEWRQDHLPRGASHYRNRKVGMPDGRLYEAEVLGIDPGSDLALLRLLPDHPGRRWPACALGDSDQLLVGQTVFAMGNPFLLATDFTPTVTFGIVSGTHRYQEGQGHRLLVYPDCIQVDAAVNPGNSGGPLFDEHGLVVGINGRIAIGDRGRVNVGVGFAIASNQIRNFLGDLLAGRHAEHGTLDLSARWMERGTGESRRHGVFVQQMFKDSVAAAAGIALGDEITRFDGEVVRSANQLATRIGVLPAGSIVAVGFRPAQADGSFGDEREVVLRLAALDTGSSRNGPEGRLASRNNRRLAARVLLAGLDCGNEPDPAAAWSRTGPDGVVTHVVRAGERLRLSIGGLVLVRTGDRAGFAVQDGVARDLTPDEAERLRREWLCHPTSRVRLEANLRDAELLGGVQVFGRPAYRFGLPGAGECEVWTAGSHAGVAGFAFRDPLRRARIEVHLDRAAIRVVVDGRLEHGWTRTPVAWPDPVDEALFRRP
ncbi:MAG: trypsin-like peptidase domain-containing protein [Planctomycetes bacterium]|nr:trypsin-like peptidase domain-containing protein [Planctomycetota bacterium]